MKPVRQSVCALLAMGVCVGLALPSAADVSSDRRPKRSASPAAPAKGKRFALAFHATPWRDVFQWLAEELRMPYVGAPPDGTFTFTPQGTFGHRSYDEGKPYTYSLPEVIDILNAALAKEGYVLLRGDGSFSVWPAGFPIQPRRVTPDQLADCGKSELVRIFYSLKGLNAEDLAPELQKQLADPSTSIIAVATSNCLLLQGTAAALKEVCATLKALETGEPGDSASYSRKCIYVAARDAADKLNLRFAGQLKQVGKGPWKSRVHHIRADEQTNTVLMTGPHDLVRKARDYLEKIDVGSKPFVLQRPYLQMHSVPGGNAEQLAKTLRVIYPDSPSLKIQAIGKNMLAVYAPAEVQLRIAK